MRRVMGPMVPMSHLPNLTPRYPRTLSTNFDSSLNYQLTVDVGRRLTYGAGTYTIQLFAGATLLGSYAGSNLEPGAWGTINVDVSGSSFAAAHGNALQIVLTGSGQQVSFDHVRLTSSSATASIAENSANGAVVATVTGLDRDAGNTLTYSLTNNAGGRFAINSTTGQITVADEACSTSKVPQVTPSSFAPLTKVT